MILKHNPEALDHKGLGEVGVKVTHMSISFGKYRIVGTPYEMVPQISTSK